MPIGDGAGWDETTPTNATIATSIDEYDRDVRIGVRSRMAFEHEWPASQSATNQAGYHKFVTLQNQASKPTISGTQTSAIYSKTVGSGLQELFWENEAGTEVQLTARSVAGNVAQRITAISTTASTIAVTVPWDGTPPQLGEGTQIISATITGQSTANFFNVRGQVAIGGSNLSCQCAIALYIGTGSTSAAAWAHAVAAGDAQTVPFSYSASVATTAATVITLRVGENIGRTVVINSTTNGGNGFFGPANGTYILVEETRV